MPPPPPETFTLGKNVRISGHEIPYMVLKSGGKSTLLVTADFNSSQFQILVLARWASRATAKGIFKQNECGCSNIFSAANPSAIMISTGNTLGVSEQYISVSQQSSTVDPIQWTPVIQTPASTPPSILRYLKVQITEMVHIQCQNLHSAHQN